MKKHSSKRQLHWQPFIRCLTLAIFGFFSVSTSLAETFSSGTHTIDSSVDGIFATGSDTIVTVNEPANVGRLVNDPDFNRHRSSLLAEDGARITINGGTFPGEIGLGQSPGARATTLDIYGGTFDSYISVGGILNIYGGSFHPDRQLTAGAGEVNIFGGTNFGTIGYDSSSGVQVNVYGRRFDFEKSTSEDSGDENGVYVAFPEVQFPLDVAGESFSMTDGQCSCFENRRVTGEFLDGSPVSFIVFLDGPNTGNVNLIVVPEPHTIGLALVGLASLLLLRKRQSVSGVRKA